MTKKKLLPGLIALAVIIAAVTIFQLKKSYLRSSTDEFNDKSSEPVLGIYDRKGELKGVKGSEIQHYAIKWNDAKESELPKPLLSALSCKQAVMLTIEMWSKSDNNILVAMEKGEYDEKIKKMCTEISRCSNTVYLRLNPEMEAPVQNFLWQWQPPEIYIKAFRHFAALCKELAPKAKIVWGPAGFPGDLEYWPDGDVVDVASVTLESQSELLSYKYPKGDSITDKIRLKLHRLRFIDKPVFILGSPKVKREKFKNEWVETAIAALKKEENVIYDPIRSSKLSTEISTSKNEKIIFGVYDPKLILTKQKQVSVEHVFADWTTVMDGSLKKQINEIVSRKHDVILTMEPWKGENPKNDRQGLNSILKGEYDRKLNHLYQLISDIGQTVYLRWAHEMEIPIERYAWQSQDPVTYIKAFRYVVNFNNYRPKNVRYVWGPAGDRASIEFWPGEDVVDFISIAIYGLPDKNITDHKKQESFNDIFKRKFYRMRFLNRPIFITEFGVKGPEDYQKVWMEDAGKTILKYPEVVGICYFNLSDVPEAWGDIQAPDWSISETTFKHFSETMESGR
jgi:beta-mannanase